MLRIDSTMKTCTRGRGHTERVPGSAGILPACRTHAGRMPALPASFPLLSLHPILSILSILLIPANFAAAAPQRVQFSRQVLPLLKKECAACHTGAASPGGYSMETAGRLLAGGRHGAAVVPGKSAQSTMVRYLTGELKPQMPPGRPLSMDTIALLRRWIDEGAKVDSMIVTAPRSSSSGSATASPAALRPTPRAIAPAPVTALAFAPDGKLLAAGGYQAVRLLDPATGTVVRTLPGPSDQVLALAWSPDGKWLAAAGGTPGEYGQVCLWNTGTWAKPRVLKRHADTIYSIAWRPGAPEFATASLDKTVAIWNAASVIPLRTLKDHADAVFAVAYSPDGKWLATGSADRSVKLYKAGAAGRPTASLSHGDGVTALVFGPKNDLLVSACQDRKVRVWPVKEGGIENPLRDHGEGEPVNALTFSADGGTFVWGAANHKVRLWNEDVSSQKRELSDPTDWVYAVAANPDGKLIAAGAGDGKLYLWSEPDGKLIHAKLLSPAPTAVAAGGSKPK
jgi:dipeptidyl aminopeptidase/acylaminoacyl peptidase